MIDRAVRLVFGTAARLRRDRALHPRGTTFDGVATIHPPGRSLASTAGPVAVVVRLSRGIGLPDPLPDFNGIAVRFVDAHGPGAHQDVLVTSAFRGPLVRHVLRPARTFSAATHTTVAPYRDGTGRRVLFAVPPLAAPTLEAAATTLPFSFELQVATSRGPWLDAATVTLRSARDAADADVRFDPFVTGPDLTPTGFVNRLRPAAYDASRAAAPVPAERR